MDWGPIRAWQRCAEKTVPPAPPDVDAPTDHQIDQFVAARLFEVGIAASEEADRYTLIKRLYYDLLGLPPEPDEVEAFVSDASGAPLFCVSCAR